MIPTLQANLRRSPTSIYIVRTYSPARYFILWKSHEMLSLLHSQEARRQSKQQTLFPYAKNTETQQLIQRSEQT